MFTSMRVCRCIFIRGCYTNPKFSSGVCCACRRERNVLSDLQLLKSNVCAHLSEDFFSSLHFRKATLLKVRYGVSAHVYCSYHLFHMHTNSSSDIMSGECRGQWLLLAVFHCKKVEMSQKKKRKKEKTTSFKIFINGFSNVLWQTGFKKLGL